jgi:hypothetical protein
MQRRKRFGITNKVYTSIFDAASCLTKVETVLRQGRLGKTRVERIHRRE